MNLLMQLSNGDRRIVTSYLTGLDASKLISHQLEIGSIIRFITQIPGSQRDVWMVDSGKLNGHQLEIWTDQITSNTAKAN